MSDRQLRGALVLSLLLMLVAGLLWLAEPAGDDHDPDATAEVWQVEADEVQRASIHRPSGELVLVRDEDGWQMEAPFRGRADTWRVRDLMVELERVRRGVPIEDGEAAAFGLEPPRARVVLEMPGGETRELLVGDEAPVGWRTYVLGADGVVVAVEGEIGEKLTQDARLFRDMRVVRFPPQDVRALRLESAHGTLHAFRRDGIWWLEGYGRAGPERVEDVMLAALDMRFDELWDEGAVDPIVEPRYRLELELEDGSTVALRVGERLPFGALVQVEGGPSGVLQEQALAFLGQGPKGLGDPHAFPVDRDGVEQVELDLGGVSWSASREGDGWDTPGAETIIEGLWLVRADYAAQRAPDPAESWGRVVLHQGSGTREIHLGQLDGERYRVAHEAGGAPYRVEVAGLQGLLALLEQPAP